jgi:hypothetical protein
VGASPTGLARCILKKASGATEVDLVNGTLNGVPLRKVSTLRTNYVGGFRHTTFRVLDCRVIELEEILRLDAPALFVLNLQHIEGRIVHYTADLHHGYEITIEVRAPEPADPDP